MTAPPRTCPAPPWRPGDAANAAVMVYDSLVDLDPVLVPPAAFEVAARCERFDALQPRPSQEADRRLGEWIASAAAVVETGGDVLPDWGPVAIATASDAVTPRIIAVWRARWTDQLARLRGIFAAEGDEVVLGLRRIHTAAWDDFRAAVEVCSGYAGESALLRHGSPEDVATFRQAEDALHRLSATITARGHLDKVPGYTAPGVIADGLCFADPEALRPLRRRDKGSDVLARWRLIVETYANAGPVMLTRSEALAAQVARQENRA